MRNPFKKVKKEIVKVEPLEIAEVEDRSSFNCPLCLGEGLVKGSRGIEVVCENCLGTGKV